ncbi:thioredoxin domain-containing protein, partial [Thermodesulfobacteriota bacterium]
MTMEEDLRVLYIADSGEQTLEPLAPRILESSSPGKLEKNLKCIALTWIILIAIFNSPAVSGTKGGGMTDQNKTPNHLIHEKSPYLLQHAYNPVDWRPWGEDALKKAKTEDKPILLSIGYSTCHWCHVMEKESFEDPETAEIMNAHFVCIKVDREERPDLDKLYITAVSAITGSAGWPLNVFLTPDLKPFFGGTYFPPTPRYGVVSWSNLLNLIAKSWQDPAHRRKLLVSANELTETIKKHLIPGSNGLNPGKTPDPSLLSLAFRNLADSYDVKKGGFSKAPKFPSPSNQNFLLFYQTYAKNDPDNSKEAKQASEMAGSTLKAMAKGGIYDHIGGGFHRYSTDDKWHIPHFEKMLYD